MYRLNMRPIFSSFYIRNGGLGNPVSFCNHGLWPTIISYFQYLFYGKLSLVGFPLSSHVDHVVFLGTQKQMRGSYARSIVAFVKNEHPFRNLTKGERPGQPMCLKKFASYSKTPIPTFLSGLNIAFPFPAIFGFVNIFKKYFSNWLSNFHGHGISVQVGGVN